MRVIRALHELGIEAVAVYSTADRDALHVRLADQAVCIGPPAAAESYLRISNVVAAAETTGLRRGPSRLRVPRRERRVRARVRGQRSRLHRADGGRRRADGRQGAREGGDARRRAFRSFRAPTVRSGLAGAARRGCGCRLSRLAQGIGRRRGKGMRLVSSEDELEDAFAAASAEAEAAFGDGAVYVEKLVAPARHVEIQVLCDARGRRAHARRARVLDPAPPPEAHRGVAVGGARSGDARGDGGDRRSAPAWRSATGTPGRSSSSSARTATSTSSR